MCSAVVVECSDSSSYEHLVPSWPCLCLVESFDLFAAVVGFVVVAAAAVHHDDGVDVPIVGALSSIGHG